MSDLFNERDSEMHDPDEIIVAMVKAFVQEAIRWLVGWMAGWLVGWIYFVLVTVERTWGELYCLAQT
jgi:hypothetical protein